MEKTNLSKNTDDKRIEVVAIMEILGRPAEHLVETLEKLIEEMKKEKGIQVKNKSIKEPTEMKEKNGFYSTFAEIELELESVEALALLVFKYMPAHIEVASPENIPLKNYEVGEIFTEVTRRLHSYDKMVQIIQT